jgi:hypothetical protein
MPSRIKPFPGWPDVCINAGASSRRQIATNSALTVDLTFATARSLQIWCFREKYARA